LLDRFQIFDQRSLAEHQVRQLRPGVQRVVDRVELAAAHRDPPHLAAAGSLCAAQRGDEHRFG
jgi:hypothetical protein